MGNVLQNDKQQQIVALGRLGWSLRRIEQQTGIRRETASAYLRAAGIAVRGRGRPSERTTKPAISSPGVSTDLPAPPPVDGAPEPAPSASVCEPYRTFIAEALGVGRNAMAIWQDLVDDHRFPAQYASVKRFVAALRAETSPEARVVITTAPGEEAQVDYGDGPMVRDPATGKYRRTRLFVLTLGYSRKSVRLLTWRSSTQTWAELHEEAFRRLGGTVRVIVHDYVARHIIVVMCPHGICGRGLRRECFAQKSTEARPHNGSQRGEPIEERLVVSPNGRSAAYFSGGHGWLAKPQRGLLGTRVDFGVAIRRLEAHVSEPPADHVDVHAGFKEVDGGRMTKDMRADVAAGRIGTLGPKMVCVATDDLVDTKTREGSGAVGDEEGPVGRGRRASLAQEPHEEVDRLRPERTHTPLVALAMQTYARLRAEVHVLDTQVGDLLYTGPGVVEQQEERAISKRESAARWQTAKQRGDLFALEEVRLRRRRSFDRNRGHLLRDGKILRRAAREEFEEAADDRQSMIPGAPVVMSRRLKILQEPEDAIQREELARNSREPTRGVPRHEGEKQPEPVAIGLNRRRTQPALDRKLIGEKRMHERTNRRAHGVASWTVGHAHRSNRRLASSSRSGVMVR